MSYEKAGDGALAAAAKITTAEITGCNKGHSVRFFCQHMVCRTELSKCTHLVCGRHQHGDDL